MPFTEHTDSVIQNHNTPIQASSTFLLAATRINEPTSVFNVEDEKHSKTLLERALPM